MADPIKVAYLFGAGATHAEISALNNEPQSEAFDQKEGLLISGVSDRVIEKASRRASYIKDIEMVSSASGSPNIELLISLIESSKITEASDKASVLKKLVRSDIQGILKKYSYSKFYLHKALFEMHAIKIVESKEELCGLLSLNYDDVLDYAYKGILGKDPNYCFQLDDKKNLPLLKLHGSFNWNNVRIRNKTRNIDLLPLGSSKNYLHVPYNFIWNRALEVLIECNVLRIIGSSLSQNDIHLIDLLFKAHLEKGEPFTIELIDKQTSGDIVKGNYGFFPEIKTWHEIERPLMASVSGTVANPFKTWLYYKSQSMLGKESIGKTKYLKKVLPN